MRNGGGGEIVTINEKERYQRRVDIDRNHKEKRKDNRRKRKDKIKRRQEKRR